jgi:hypothetical protein
VQPFHVTLKQFGTFGGKQRGVLWLHPADCHHHNSNSGGLSKIPITSSSNKNNGKVESNDPPATQQHDGHCPSSSSSSSSSSPLIDLHKYLVEQFPECMDQKTTTKHPRGGGVFTPHMTISHFPSLVEAETAQLKAEKLLSSLSSSSLHFHVDRIYLLERRGDDGQFLRVADIRLGVLDAGENAIQRHEQPIPFEHMPSFELEWVREERLRLKQRRRRSTSRRRGNRSS